MRDIAPSSLALQDRPRPRFDDLLDPLVVTPPAPCCEVCVVIPVRDKAATLDATLHALARQVDRRGRPLAHHRYEIVLLANNCRDGSATVARRFAARHPTLALHIVERMLPPAEANVGRARRLLMDEAYRRLSLLGRPHGVIASTDGDTVVAPDWLDAMLDAVARGADAVGGRIIVDTAGLPRGARAYYLRDTVFRLLVSAYEAVLDPDPHDPWPRHHQHFGASLAVTTAAYDRAGGLPAVPMLEDVAFVQALRRADAPIRHSPVVRVVTSGRRDTHAHIGLATQLGEWAALERERQPWLVESAASLEERLRARRALRQLWKEARAGEGPRERDVRALAGTLGIDEAWLADMATRQGPYGLFIDTIERRQAEEGVWTCDLIEVTKAIAQLRERLPVAVSHRLTATG